jgi:RNA 3'-terminal phosphate cyclase (ATP)
MLLIDGSHGEGGGQVLRTSLSLAAITGQAIRLTRIRAGRSKPGLAAQHLTCVRAAAEVCGAEVSGDRLGSQDLQFRPGSPRAGEHVFDVAEHRPSAGSVNLILQTVLPILARCEQPSRVTLRGGTHVPWSPTFEHVAHVFLPAVARFGIQAGVTLAQAGYYPRGGGEEALSVQPSGEWTAADFARPLGELRCRAYSFATKLPAHVAERQRGAMEAGLPGSPVDCLTGELPGPFPGTTAMVVTEPGQGGWGGCSALGERGKPAETVGREAAEAFAGFAQSRAPVERHLADQLLLYAALARGTTALTVEALTEHTRTNLWVIERFLGPRSAVHESPLRPPTLTLNGR